MTNQAQELYQKLYQHFGPQLWWPGDSPFEVCVGAILTQNTNWSNVEKAILNLKKESCLTPKAIHQIPVELLEDLIRPAGFFRQKAQRLKNFVEQIEDRFGSFEKLFELEEGLLREFLLGLNGIGPETADSMVLYAFGHARFVVDAYTKRILVRHNLMDEEADYDRLQDFFESRLAPDVQMFNETHALIVTTAKAHCRKTKPVCESCPLKDFNGGPRVES